ncbi:MAG: carboxypeptidase-like regulatory domain-containing protein [Planctomycetota bacterium]|nr:carboxypeptidase-like regulatory domain-containing protein [Planctomycetota bacterium]
MTSDDRHSAHAPASRRARRALTACAAAAAAAVAALLWSTDAPRPPRPPAAAAASAGAPPEPRTPAPASASIARPERPAARAVMRQQAPHEQGISGRLVDASGSPVTGASVQLHASPDHDPAKFVLPARRRHLRTPVAAATSDASGAFAVGLATSSDASYDVLVRSDRHATLRLAGVRLLAGAWYDVGALTLGPGATLRGRVTVAGAPALAAPNAVVTVVASGAFGDAGADVTPGALTADADSDGRYVIEHAPTHGIVQVSAVAPGFARVVRRDVVLTPGAAVVADFALPAGATLAGLVTTPDGAPVAEAAVSAWPQQPGGREVRSYTDPRGAFSLSGLPTGPLRVVATAPGCARLERRDVRVGEPLALTLWPSNRIYVTAKTPAGEVLRRYRLAIRRFYPAAPVGELDADALAAGDIGPLPSVPEQRVRLDGATDAAQVDGLPAGTFVCEVVPEGWAKTLSRPLRFSTPGPGATSVQRVEVIVTRGATLRGRVLDAEGQPLSEAVVTTIAPSEIQAHAGFRALQRAAPHRVTRRSVNTGPDGRFAIEGLALGAYALRVDHPDTCREKVLGIECNHPYGQQLPDIQMRTGALVRGTATVANGATPPIQIVLTTTPATPPERSIRLETVTDGEGCYRFDRRIPPGSYVLRAAALGSSAPDAEIFRQMLQFQKSTTTLLIPEGQRTVERDLALPAK